jgi:hypothetical protein
MPHVRAVCFSPLGTAGAAGFDLTTGRDTRLGGLTSRLCFFGFVAGCLAGFAELVPPAGADGRETTGAGRDD